MTCLVSVDGTWQKRGHQSLLGAVYVIGYQTAKVLDYVFCKFCHDCNLNNNWDKYIADFLAWKESHESECESNFDCSSGSIEPVGLVQLFKRSLDYNLRYKHFVSDGDGCTLASLMKEKPYGEACGMVKEDCIGRIKKRMGSAPLD